MTRLSSFAVALILANAAGAVAQQPQPLKLNPAPSTGDDLTKKASYALGLSIGENLHSQGLELDFQSVADGLRDGLSGAEPKMTDAEIEQVMRAFQQQVAKAMSEKLKALGEKNAAEGKAFQAANGEKDGVKTLPSGLQYKVLKKGDGPSPKASDTVTTHYRGTLINGDVFDSSYDRGEPATFPVNGVIQGWQEALPMMKVGDKWQLVVPSNMAYGERGAPGGQIGPNATLVFEVELLGIE